MVDSYRPSRRGGARPSLQDRITFTSGGGDSYRPNDAQSQHQSGGQNRSPAVFTFSAGNSGPQFPPAGPAADTRSARKSKRSRGGSGPSGDNHRDSERSANPTSSHPGSRRNQNDYQRGGRRPAYRKKAPHERPLLQSRVDTTSEHILGSTDGSNKFRNVDDLSEDEADMELETDNGDGESPASDPPAHHKMARRQSSTRADGNSVPKWSNPDPYTVLPPPDETTGKKRDVVQLIRRAKNQAPEKAASSNAVIANDDFISFGLDEDEPEDDDHPMWALNNYALRGSLNEAVPTGPASMASGQKYVQRGPEPLSLPKKPPPQTQPKAHKRKRGEFEGGILREWLADSHTETAPWATDYSHLRSDMTKWLHNEILDFYDLVRPDPHETSVRTNLIRRIESALGTQYLTGATGHVLCFGSFPAGLYLPTADMDLVYATDRLRGGGPPALNFNVKSQVTKVLWRAARKLESRGVAVDMTVISRAKVPIVKFVDSITGIKVDLSFENLTGMEAQQTYKEWISTWPDMIPLVALVKQFLAMRGLNDVHLGGLGGFSIICLVVSFLQLAPPSANLGESFMNFLDYYGNNFDLARKRIVMKPPRLANKTQIGIDGRPEKADGLSIEDPNLPSNNISGGSHNVKDIFQAFGDAYRTLQDRVNLLRPGGEMNGHSVLESILGGNYESYTSHRAHLRNVE
ncbi:hypothetical protein K505DRAFT_351822 [Melanomma pulvis-pyrius CBS 109.77]|uniref:polynucleotide adenylyltransferase n=1 Tax=Melanomma pulvis-pyrius CBS 109.77 TaxID=1314802 RepID=A0A6A6X2R9_9PLEO|nr:hypothetical protein K505DRAFT_351822 [Melanomma pulvis-pyrius CBS 109.77]